MSPESYEAITHPRPRPGTWIMHMYHGKGRKGLKPLHFQPWLGSMMLLDAMTALGWLTGKNNSDSLTADAFGVTFRWQPRSVGLFDFPGDDYTPSPPPSSPVHPPTLPRRTPTPSPERSPSSTARELYPEYFTAVDEDARLTAERERESEAVYHAQQANPEPQANVPRRRRPISAAIPRAERENGPPTRRSTRERRSPDRLDPAM